MSEFTSRVKKLLSQKQMTQKELSKLSNIAEASICRYLRGDSEPRLDILSNIARALDVSEAYLIGQTDEIKPSDYKLEIRDIVARNRKRMSDKDKMDIINMLYGRFDDK